VTRRVDLNICEPPGNGFRFGEANRSQNASSLVPEASAVSKKIAQDRDQVIDGQLAARNSSAARASRSRTSCSIVLDFGATVGQPLVEDTRTSRRGLKK